MRPTPDSSHNTGFGAAADRERLLMRYADALLRGDLDAQERLTTQAEATGDLALSEMLWEMHVAVGAEMMAEAEQETVLAGERDAATVRDLAAASFPGRLLERPEDARVFQADQMAEVEEIPPVTVGEVAASVRAEVARGKATSPQIPAERAAAMNVLRRLEQSDEALPERITPKAIRTLLSRFGAEVGGWLERQFHEAAAHMTLGRSNQAMRLAAARRVREARPRYAAAAEKPAAGNASAAENEIEDAAAAEADDEQQQRRDDQ